MSVFLRLRIKNSVEASRRWDLWGQTDMERSKQTTDESNQLLLLDAVVINLLFQADDIHTFWHGACCVFVKKADQRHSEGMMIKNLYQTREDLLWRVVLGKIWEFVFLVDDYHYAMTHSWGWVLSVRIFFRPLYSTHTKGWSFENTRLSPRCPHCLGSLLALLWLRLGVDGFLVSFLNLSS